MRLLLVEPRAFSHKVSSFIYIYIYIDDCKKKNKIVEQVFSYTYSKSNIEEQY